jgi:hypothetical protein
MRALLALVAVLGFYGARPAPAEALTFTCIESSKYKYLLKLFEDDPKQLAAALGTDPAAAPPPEACRAALATEGTAKGDPQRLVEIIAQNKGWLATIYLNSGGGDVGAATRSAVIVRDFWLGTKVMPGGGSFVYQPDFVDQAAGATPDPGHAAFAAAVQAVPTPVPASAFCASACTFILAAGVDREGVARVHRCGVNGDTLQAVSDSVAHCVATIRSLYQHMGVGDAFLETAADTAKQTTAPITMPRFPAVVEDALTERCKSDGAQLNDVAALLKFALRQRARAAGLVETGALAASLDKVEARSQETEHCITGWNDRDRLAAFSKLCSHGCSDRSLDPVLSKQIKELTP